ncbi:relaxase/mobilization nuclease domain-containing protein [Phaeobacter inhibens]|uniref:relaxase/mobilization nuclease domain-containing protein n=1 Tax=Phaeobacter inhibens TaxID=221822 RepID=UPI0024B74030|nr:relaxase/mobilization nuclease domain-containing protein [Phaeobacter inhibens]WHP69402.1 relaxase/mobilization nuclease domain-containing protein [Phaeobacter inhibens]
MKDENERVEVHQVRGFASDDLLSAFRESFAMSRATKCKQHLFSLSMNPPQGAELSAQDFEKTADRAEEKLGLTGQPRAIVLHTKNGRTHAHAVWSRINTEEMRAVQMSFSKRKMQDLSRELYREHGWQMPRGFVRHAERDPRNFTLAEWQQCKRAKRDPKQMKEVFQDAWAISDSRAAFANALKANGLILAKGDRRSHIAVDHNGEAYAISRYAGIKAKQVRERFGKPDDLPSKENAHRIAAERVAVRLAELKAEQERIAQEKLRNLEAHRERQAQEQTRRAEQLRQKQFEQHSLLKKEQQARIRTGLRGLLDRFTGRRRKTEARNEIETLSAQRSAYDERQELIAQRERAKQEIQRKASDTQARKAYVQRELLKDMQSLRQAQDREATNKRDAFKQSRRTTRERSKRLRQHPHCPTMEP